MTHFLVYKLILDAKALMIMRYREQWLLWIIVDGVTVVMRLQAKDFLLTAM